ncbi:glycosyltransferase family 39 protein [Spirulina subsalsa FACHB-351]|uniref:Glycosyltransferase family 39 protein n=1 Tax=Spirulina subsalsa FACHB-351 TaxID=234711 RepID=A0ABT3L9P2_9CYAN|nr:glycosyltransferase family 39 protein [Spirulina subsalsa]MCW6038216.1 glycosyltransferase family 39 protein [Spirulina subsalsa FACHB-351]
MLTTIEKFIYHHRFLIFHGLLPLTFFLFTFAFMPIREVFQFDTDEGQEMIKTLLYQQGFSLYSEIWSDQPPLFTLILDQWLKIWGNSILAARCLILCFATFLIWTFAQLLRLTVGNLYALLGAFFLAISCNFFRLSVSVMIGLPALAFALLSIYSLFEYLEQEKKRYWLVFSGLFFGISLQLKMFTILLLPLILTYLLLFSLRQKPQSLNTQNWATSKIWMILCPISLFLLALTLIYILPFLVIPQLSLQQVFQQHIDTDLKSVFARENSILDTLVMYLQELDYTLLAALTIPSLLRVKNLEIKQFPLFWLILATVMLLNHKPIWYHHAQLISIPLTWLAVMSIKSALETLEKYPISLAIKQRKYRQIIPRNLAVYFLIFSLAVIPVKLTITYLNNQSLLRASQQENTILQDLIKTYPNTQWLFTDIPMYAVYAHWQVPPEIATLSRKRVASDEFTREYLDQLILKYQPEQVLMARFPEVLSYFKQSPIIDYYEVKRYEGATHYLRQNLR